MTVGAVVGGFLMLSVMESQVVLDFRIVVDLLEPADSPGCGRDNAGPAQEYAWLYYILFFFGTFPWLIVPARLRGFCTGIRLVADQNTRVTRITLFAQ